MADATAVLIADHQKVEALFGRVEGQTGPDADIVNSIVRELSVHDSIEKQLLYPTLRDRVAGGRGMADNSLDEHTEVATVLSELDGRGPDDVAVPKLLVRLMHLVRTHVREEETQIFPAMRSAMSVAELDELGDALLAAKEKAPTRPHPNAPASGLGQKVAGAVAAPLDKVRDHIQGR